MPATINGTTGFGGNLTGNVTGNVTGTSSAVADGAVSAAKLDGAQTGSAPIYGCRAWVNFDGTSVTNVGGEDRCTIRASGNVTKVVRNGTGDYTVHFTTALQDALYAASFSAAPTVNSGNPLFQLSSNVAGSCRFNIIQRGTGTIDNASTVTAMFIR